MPEINQICRDTRQATSHRQPKIKQYLFETVQTFIDSPVTKIETPGQKTKTTKIHLTISMFVIMSLGSNDISSSAAAW